MALNGAGKLAYLEYEVRNESIWTDYTMNY